MGMVVSAAVTGIPIIEELERPYSVYKNSTRAIQGLPSVCEFSAFRHFFKANVAQSVAELVLYSQKTRNVVIFYQFW